MLFVMDFSTRCSCSAKVVITTKGSNKRTTHPWFTKSQEQHAQEDVVGSNTPP